MPVAIPFRHTLFGLVPIKGMKVLTIAFNAGWNLSTWVYHYSNR